MEMRSNLGDNETLVRSCPTANQDPEVKGIEQEWNEILDVIDEPWGDVAEL
jgi:hypothetical protein